MNWQTRDEPQQSLLEFVSEFSLQYGAFELSINSTRPKNFVKIYS